ncbi:4Fe-4S binding protein [Parablautia sp. Marseille-Q6255]|uniref:4Fe-4S binding protein n=1 Tax=Parablautia sp. Marseille-Q6255 TaxID=3039593 RepID=UPI0024BBEFB8|nr:4Fe-4S binding protein [Parablautia sp. Marseille-Q6255]
MDKKVKNTQGKNRQGVSRDPRLWVQVIVAAVTNGYALGFLKGKIYTGPLKNICVPGLNCYSCPGALGSCPIGSLQAVLGARNFRFSFYLLGFFMVIGAIFGRFVCGWLCPFGLIQDLLHKIPFPFKRKNLPGHRLLVYLKYVVLVVMVILLPLVATDFLGQGRPWFCQYLCPSGTLLAGIPLTLTNEPLRAAAGFLFQWKLLILIVCVVGAIAYYRPFCKYLCPLGAVYGLFHPIAFYRYEVDEEKCTRCGKCQRVCKMDIPVWKEPNSRECIRCGACVRACPTCAVHRKPAGKGTRADQNDTE